MFWLALFVFWVLSGTFIAALMWPKPNKDNVGSILVTMCLGPLMLLIFLGVFLALLFKKFTGIGLED